MLGCTSHGKKQKQELGERGQEGLGEVVGTGGAILQDGQERSY